MELKMQEIKNTPLIFNFEELKKELSTQLKAYSNYVVDESNLKVASEDLAKLRKLRQAFETKRKEVKKECEKPYKAFEEQVKELTGIIDSNINTIKNQTDYYEEQRKEAKRLEVNNLFDTLNVDGVIKIHQVWNESWLNKTFTLKEVEKEMTTALDKVKTDLDTIEKLNYTDEQKKHIKCSYLVCLDLNKCIRQEDEAIENYKHYVESKNKALEQQKQETSVIVPPTPQTSVETPKTSVKRYSSVMRFTDNVENMKKLKKFLDETGIKYEIIENMKEVE